MKFIFTLVVAIQVSFLGGCSLTEKEEYWAGYYLYPNHNRQFEIFMELTVKGEKVAGFAYQGGDTGASLSGDIKGDRYSILLHPLSEGKSTEQDIHYIGQRADNKITGQ